LVPRYLTEHGCRQTTAARADHENDPRWQSIAWGKAWLKEGNMSFKVGDVVQLKSGGPLMTVVGFGADANGNQRVNCTWFDEKNIERNGAFPAEALQPYDPETDAIGFGIA
jgi:uncharacterized protein YodC (DUF2158 family)